MNWLLVTNKFPPDLFHGSVLRMHRFARRFIERGDTAALLTGPAPDPAAETPWRDIGVEILAPAAPPAGPVRSRRLLSPYAFDPRLAERIKQEAPHYDVAVLLNSPAMQYLPDATGAGMTVMDMVDDHLLEFDRRGASRRPMIAARRLKTRWGLRGLERSYLRLADLTVMVSEVDAESFAARNPGARVEIIPIGVDADVWDRPARIEPFEQPTFVFVGNLRHGANADAARRIVRRIGPRVAELAPRARFAIVGPNAPADLAEAAGANVEIAGRVDDVKPWLWRAAGALLPMVSGTGLKTKLLEAWAAGAAVIATPMTCQGVPARDGENILLGDSDDDLARLCARLADDAAERARLGAAGREAVRRDYDWNHVAEGFRRLVCGPEQAPTDRDPAQVKRWAYATS